MLVWEIFNVATDEGIEDLTELPQPFQGNLSAEDLADVEAWLTDAALLAIYANRGFRLVERDDPDPVTPRIMDRFRWMTALQMLGGTAIVFGAVDTLGPGNATFIYFHETPYFDRDAAEYNTVEGMLGATETDTDAVFDLANTLPLPTA